MNTPPLTGTTRIVLAVTSQQSLRLLTGFPEFLARRGWDVHVVAANVGDWPLISPDVTWHALGMRREPSPWADLLSIAHWIRLLLSIRPDVVVAGTPKAGLLGMLAALIVRVPMRIYLLRGLRLETAAGWRRVVLSMTERLSSRCSHHVIAVSASLRDEYVRRGLVPNTKISVVGAGSSNGVDLSPAVDSDALARAAEELGIDPGQPVVGFVGRVTADKGVPDLLRAVRLLHEQDVSIRILVVGGEEPTGALKRMCADAGVDPASVVWAGHVTDPTPYYGLMTLLCLPTSREGFPNVVLEAAAVGIPSVVTTATGAVDSVIDGRTGLVYAAGDVAALASRLSSVLSGQVSADELGAAARHHVETHYGREHVWSQNEALYLRLLTVRGRCGPVMTS